MCIFFLNVIVQHCTNMHKLENLICSIASSTDVSIFTQIACVFLSYDFINSN